jgi:dephospho-CoA kinase
MRILGLTGSIGMGKSTTAKLFTEAGVPVYDADAAVHKIYEGEAAPAIEAAFPGTTVDGRVDRAKLSAKVVHDQAAIKQLEQIVHPMLGASRERILARGTMTNEALDGILARQLPDAEKRQRADFVVDTSHGLDPVRTAIRDILAEVVKMPQRRT